MEIDSESRVKASDEGASATQTEATTSSGTNSTAEMKDDIAVSMENLQIDKSSSGASGFKKKLVIIIRNDRERENNIPSTVCHTQATNSRGYVMNLDPASKIYMS